MPKNFDGSEDVHNQRKDSLDNGLGLTEEDFKNFEGSKHEPSSNLKEATSIMYKYGKEIRQAGESTPPPGFSR